MNPILKAILKPLAEPFMPFINKVQTANKLVYGRDEIRKQILEQQENDEPVKITVGASGTEFDGWIATDMPYLNVLHEAEWNLIAKHGVIDRILAEHVFEHLTEGEFSDFLDIVRPFLSENGRIRVAVPDGYHPDLDYIEYVRPGGTGAGADDHKVLYNFKTMTRLLLTNDYDYQLLEYFDEKGTFHHVDWDAEDGYIHRSAENDWRNQEKALSYTSLIVDFWSTRKIETIDSDDSVS